MTPFQIHQILTQQKERSEAWTPFLDVPTLTLGVYTVREPDQETHAPHPRDEVYYVVSGRGVLHAAGMDQPLGPGSIAYVPAGEAHHYHSIEEELVLLVFFAGPA
jgi:mannose-6-phosphate isomerase-like protein (cupin superfamily)